MMQFLGVKMFLFCTISKQVCYAADFVPIVIRIVIPIRNDLEEIAKRSVIEM